MEWLLVKILNGVYQQMQWLDCEVDNRGIGIDFLEEARVFL
jgi:hypothetical protein